MQQNIARLDKKELLISVGIFSLALFVRLFYLYESSANPSFTIPTVDSKTYDNLARLVAHGKPMTHEFFWQPFFYPAFLSAIYLAGNSSIICAKLVQLLLGCVTCLLTYRLGKAIFNPVAGIIAGVMTALYGPLVFFEAELLAAGWAAFWSIVLVLLFIKSSSKKSVWLCLVLGICGALSVITRPTFIPFFTAAVVWLAVIFCRADAGWRRIALRLGAVLTGFLFIAIPVAAQNFRLTGHFGFLPGSGGINLYVGNNPNYAETVTARPGYGWRELVDLSKRNGIIGDQWEHQKFFKQKVVNYMLTEPLGFVRGLAYKTVQFLNSREIPRNVDVYLFGKWSRLLGLLTWKVAGFGFPFGVLLPLALLGAVSFRRQVPVPLLLFVILYPLSIILIFVAARYRVVIIPVMSVMAAAGLLNLVNTVRGLYWRRMVIISAFGVAIVLLSSLPGPFPEEELNLEAEFYSNLATSANEQGKSEEAVKYSLEALRLKPDYAEARNNLGLALHSQGKLDEAISHYRQALHIRPAHAEAHQNLASVLAFQGKFDEAINHFRQAMRLRLDYAQAYNNLGIALQSQGKLDEAINHFRQAVRIEPDYAQAYNNLGIALQSQGKLDETISHFRQAIKIEPDYAAAHHDLGNALRLQGKLDEAISHFRQALQIEPDNARAHNNLAGVLASQGKLDGAISHFRQALRIKPDYALAHNNLGIALQSQGKLDEALSHYRQALQIRPNYAGVHSNLGVVLQSQGKLDEAISHFRQALQIEPDNAKAYNNLAEVLASQGKLDEAISHFRQALRIKPDYALAHNNLRRVLATRQGKLDEAITRLTEAVQLNPDSASSHYALARALTKSGKTSGAIKHLRESLRLEPDWVEPMNSLAWLLATHHEAKFRNPEEAVRLAERVCELTNYNDAGFVDTLAAAYAAVGRFSDAVSAAEKAVKLAAGSKERSQKIQKRLELYQASRPYRQPSAAAEKGGKGG